MLVFSKLLLSVSKCLFLVFTSLDFHGVFFFLSAAEGTSEYCGGAPSMEMPGFQKIKVNA